MRVSLNPGEEVQRMETNALISHHANLTFPNNFYCGVSHTTEDKRQKHFVPKIKRERKQRRKNSINITELQG